MKKNVLIIDGQGGQLGRQMVEAVVPTYHPAGEHGSEAKPEAYEEQMKQVNAQEAVQV